MNNTPYQQVRKLLDELGIQYEVTSHQAVRTSQEARQVTGYPLKSAAKSILFKVEKEYVLVVLRGDKMADFKKLKQHFGARKARLARPDEVLSVMGVEIGACYPFGELAGVSMVVDETLRRNQTITFSPGMHEKHIAMAWSDYERATRPTLIDVIKH